jgi:hypothetical protein
VAADVMSRPWSRIGVTFAVMATMTLVQFGFSVPAKATPLDSVFDRTYSCVATPLAAPWVEVQSQVTLPAKAPGYFDLYSSIDPSPGDNDITYLEFVAKANVFRTDPRGCRSVKRAVPLTSRGLPSNGVLTSTFLGGFDDKCKVNGRIDVHVRLTFVGGVAVAGMFAVQTEKGGIPVAFVKWAPMKEATFLSSRCTST